MRCVKCLSLLHYSTSGMLCRACGRLEPHNHNKKLYCVKCFTPLDNIEKYDLWCKTCLMDVMNTRRCWKAVSSHRHKTKIMQLSHKLKSILQGNLEFRK